jgi:hypothetical protein
MVGLLALFVAKPGQDRNVAAICKSNKCQGKGSPPNHSFVNDHAMSIIVSLNAFLCTYVYTAVSFGLVKIA